MCERSCRGGAEDLLGKRKKLVLCAGGRTSVRAEDGAGPAYLLSKLKEDPR